MDMVNTPELMQADNDYAVGLLVQKIANSIYAQNTLIFVVEDDAQDGADHVDSHRTIAFVAGAYVKQGAVISTHYNTIAYSHDGRSVGAEAIPESERRSRPPHDRYLHHDTEPWQFTAAPSAYLYASQLPLPGAPVGMKVPKSTHTPFTGRGSQEGWTSPTPIESIRLCSTGFCGREPCTSRFLCRSGRRIPTMTMSAA